MNQDRGSRPFYRILYIDDEPKNAQVIRSHLDGIDGWEIELRTCVAPREALGELRRLDFDVVLLDRYLGSDSGLVILEFIISASLNRFQPVIMITGRGNEKLAISAIRSGVVDYIPSGHLSPATLEQAIRNAALKAEMRAEVERQRVELERLARVDPLTGTLNRRAFDEALERETLRSLRFGSPLSLVMIDLDHFKNINDGFGHLAGDDILCRVAQILRSNTRATDACSRWGGDEFAALLCGTGQKGASIHADRLRSRIESMECSLAGDHPHITCSVGIAEFDASMKTPKGLVAAADRALYRAKRNGRNQVAVDPILGTEIAAMGD